MDFEDTPRILFIGKSNDDGARWYPAPCPPKAGVARSNRVGRTIEIMYLGHLRVAFVLLAVKTSADTRGRHEAIPLPEYVEAGLEHRLRGGHGSGPSRRPLVERLSRSGVDALPTLPS